jgi:addiction module HigA family antidote
VSTLNNITEGRESAPPEHYRMAEYKAGPMRRRPTHPGRIVKTNLEAMGLSVNAAALAIGVTRAALGNIVVEKSAISPEMALRLSKLMGGGPDLWMKMQADVDLWDAKQKIGGELKKIKQLWDAGHIPVED